MYDLRIYLYVIADHSILTHKGKFTGINVGSQPFALSAGCAILKYPFDFISFTLLYISSNCCKSVLSTFTLSNGSATGASFKNLY